MKLLKNNLFFSIKRKRDLKHFYKSLVHKGALCFDIGANQGKKSLILLELKTKVIAFEPQSNCASFLNKIQNKYDSFKYKKLAIGSENTSGELSIGNHIEIATLSTKFIDYFQTEDIFWENKEKVEIVTLNSQIEKYGIPSFCKIDAEGYELNILSSLSYAIPIIEFEFTGGFINETELIIDKIAELGDYEFNYILNENPNWIQKTWTNHLDLKTEIESLPIERLHGNIFAKLKNYGSNLNE